LQNLPIPRYRAQQGREQTVFHHLQLMWFKTQCHRHQDWFLCPSRKETKTTRLDGTIGLVVGHRERLFGRPRGRTTSRCGRFLHLVGASAIMVSRKIHIEYCSKAFLYNLRQNIMSETRKVGSHCDPSNLFIARSSKRC